MRDPRRMAHGSSSHQSANSASASNSTLTTKRIASPVNTSTLTCRRRKAASFAFSAKLEPCCKCRRMCCEAKVTIVITFSRVWKSGCSNAPHAATRLSHCRFSMRSVRCSHCVQPLVEARVDGVCPACLWTDVFSEPTDGESSDTAAVRGRRPAAVVEENCGERSGPTI